MRFPAVADVIGSILLFFSLTMLAPVLVALLAGEPVGNAVAFLGPCIIGSIAGILLRHLTHERPEHLRDREAFVAVGGGWLVVTAFAAFPFYLIATSSSALSASGTLTTAWDAYFEAMSGLTTTGFTVVPDVTELPASLLFYRSYLQWLGGFGIIVISVLILGNVGSGAVRLLRAEASGTNIARFMPKLRDVAVRLWGIYLFFTVTGFLLLLVAGLSPLDAIAHTMAAVSTGGFSTQNSSVGSFNDQPAVGIIIYILMLVCGMNFNLHYEISQGRLRQTLRDPELQGYLLLLGVATLIVATAVGVARGGVGGSVPETSAHASFTTLSLMTSTGFSTTDFDVWPTAAKVVLLLLMFVGGMTGSTAGGVKIVRFIVLAKVANREIQQLVHPRAVAPVRLGGRALPEERVHGIIAFVIIYALLLVLITFLASLTGLDLESSLAGTAASMGNTGNAFGALGPTQTAHDLHPAAKVLFIIAMWLGRLEIFAGLVLFFPATYKK